MDHTAAPLLWQEGALVEQISWDGQAENAYSAFTPLVTLRIALSKLPGAPQDKLQTLPLSSAQPGGSLMLRRICGVF